MLEIHPEVVRLRDECERLAAQHALLIADLDLLRHNLIPQLAARYMLTFGPSSLDLLTLRCENQRRRRLLEMAQADLNRGERPCLELIERKLEDELETWHSRMRDLQRELDDANLRRDNRGPVSAHDLRELKSLYRRMVHRLHPDLHPDLGESGRILWLRLQDAYTRCDLESLRTLALLVDDFGPNADAGWMACSVDILREQRQRLSAACMQCMNEEARLKAGFPYDHRERLDDPAWVRAKNEELQKEIAVETARRERLGERLTAMLGDAWKWWI